MRVVFALFAGALLAMAQRNPVDEAWDLVARGEHDKAAGVLERVIRVSPRDADARLLLGAILMEQGKLPGAVVHLSEAVRLRPQAPEAHHALGEALRSSGDRQAARDAFQKAVVLKPDFAQAHADLGVVLLEGGESAAAAEHLHRAIALMGRTPEAAFPHYLRAKIHSEQSEVDKAAAQLKQAVALRPDFAEAWSDLGKARKTLLDDAGALEAFRRAVELNPGGAIAQYRLGAEYLSQGDLRNALVHLRESYRLNPGDQSTLYSLMLALRKDGKAEEAAVIRQKLGQALRNIDTESQAAFAAVRLNNEGAELEKRGELRAALDKYREAVSADPAHVGIRVNYAVALLRQAEWKEGLAQLREAAKRDPGNDEVQAALKDALRQAPPEFGGQGKLPAARPPAGKR